MRAWLNRVVLFTPCLGLAVACASSVENTPAEPHEVAASAPTASAAGPRASSTAEVEAPDLTEGEDVTAEMRRVNSDEFAAPPDTFRSGHVTPRKLDKGAIAKQKRGFKVQLPSRAPITTPAVHAGIVLTSGGFHSKQIFAFKAKSGDFAWAIDLDDDGPSAPACEDEVCVFNTESCTVFAIAAQTGEMLWSWWLGDPLTSAPTIAGGRVFTSFPAQGNTATYGQQAANSKSASKAASSKQRPPGMSHALAAFDLQSGELVWRKWIDADVMSAPVAVGDAVFATTFAGTVYKLDQSTGSIVGARKDRATSAPVIAHGDIFYTKRTDDQKSGTAEEGIARSSKRPGKRYVTARKQAVYLDRKVQSKSTMWKKGKSLDASNGFGGGAPASANAHAAEGTIGQASVSTMQAFQGSRVLNVGTWNVNSMGDEVVCTDSETGRERWRHKLDGNIAQAGGFLAAPPAAAGRSVFVATLSGDVLQIDPKSGKVQRRHAIGSPIRSQPVVDDGWLYVGTNDGRLVAIDLGDTRLTGWSQWGGNAARTGTR